jgi:hypothetical protein
LWPILCPLRKGIRSPPGVVKRNARDRKNTTVHIAWISTNPVHAKPNGRGLRLCIDYRALNKITLANQYPLPIMTKLEERVRGCKIFTKIDLKNGYHLIRIEEGPKSKTAFYCRYGLYEFLVMPCRLTNTPDNFQDMMNHILKDLLDKGVVVYIDDILIYAKNTEQYDKLLEEVLERLAKNELDILPEKCVWAEKDVEFLGYITTLEGMRMAKDKTEAIQDRPTPQSLSDVQPFLGFATFYRRFIFGFSKVCRPLIESTKGDKKDWR